MRNLYCLLKVKYSQSDPELVWHILQEQNNLTKYNQKIQLFEDANLAKRFLKNQKCKFQKNNPQDFFSCVLES